MKTLTPGHESPPIANRRGVPLGARARLIINLIAKHTTRTTHDLAAATGMGLYQTASACHGLARAGHIRLLTKGKPGKTGHPAVWTTA